jgi:uncharacterized protein (DUF1015 family)
VIVKPFRAIRPKTNLAEAVNVPPYDVVDRKEVRERTKNNPASFFHITRSDAELENLTDEHSEAVYEKAKENFYRFLSEGTLIREKKPSFYVLSQKWMGRTQTGIFAAVSCEEYEKGLIKKHELTRKEKEFDRTMHIMTVGADTGPVFLSFEKKGGFSQILKEIQKKEPLYHFTDENSVENTLWIAKEDALVQKIESYFQSIPAFYIADGHHRAASALNVWKKWKESKGNEHNAFHYFMAVIFPSDELSILPYHRVIADLNKLSREEFLSALQKDFFVKESRNLEPKAKGKIGLYLEHSVYQLSPKNKSSFHGNKLDSLDVSILQNRVLAPVLGIDDPRTSQRIRFVGGIKGPKELIRQVDEGSAKAAFCLHPVSIKDWIAITNQGSIMPPKSTWFEPKLRDGLITYPIVNASDF